jgi:hypothetical protein
MLVTLRYNHSRHWKCPATWHHSRAKNRRTHCEGKGTTTMSDTPTDDKSGFVAEKPEHCFACYRLIRLD